VESGSSQKNTKDQRKNLLFLSHQETRKRVEQLHQEVVTTLKDPNQPPKKLQPRRVRKNEGSLLSE
jgi:hypothetical protein